MKSENLPTFPILTPDERIWRIDWFGEIAYPGAVRQYKQPCIKVSISPWLDSPSSTALSGGFHTDIAQQRNIWVPLSALSMLRIGDLWQHGLLLSAPFYSQTLFELDISPETTTFVKAGLAVEENYLLPFSEHPWHRFHTQSYCLKIKTLEEQTLIIPGAELVRFYFGTSSTLIKRLVTAPFKEEMLWQKKNHDSASGHLHLKLTPGLYSTSAQDIGRIALDPYALRSACGIYSHIVKATSQGDPAYLYTGFPFRGRTSLTAACIWLSFAGRPKSTFIVFHLYNCSYPFPYGSLSIDRIERTAKRKGAAGDNTKQEVGASASSRDAKIEHGDPGNRKRPRHFNLDRSIRFPDLARKPFWSEQVVAESPCGALTRRSDGTFEKLAFGEPEGAGDARAIDIGFGEPEAQVVADSASNPLPRFVRIGMDIVKSQHSESVASISARPLLPFGRGKPTFMLPMVVDMDGIIDTSLMHTGLDGEQRMKRACFVGLFESDRETKKIAIVEGNHHQSAPTVVAVEDTDLLHLLECFYAEQQGGASTLLDAKRRSVL